MENEVWKDIFGYEGYYQISNLGKVKSINRTTKRKKGTVFTPERILKQNKNPQGYLYVNLCKESVVKLSRIHRLVAENFIPNPENKLYVNHISGIKSENNINNLEWVTASENLKHAYSIGLNYISEKNKLESKIRSSKKVINTNTGEIFESITDAAKSINLDLKSLSKILKNKCKNKTGLDYLT